MVLGISPSFLAAWLGRHRVVQAVLFALAGLLYANSVPNQWAVDDIPIVSENQLVRRGLAGVPAIFTHDAFYGYYQTDLNALTGGRYRPPSSPWKPSCWPRCSVMPGSR